MQLLTTRFNKTPQFVTWQLKLIAAARRLHPAKKEAFSRDDFLDIAELGNIFFALQKVKQVDFHELMIKLDTRYTLNGTFSASPTEAVLLLRWVIEVTDLVGEYSMAAFNRAKADHDRYTEDFKKRNGVKRKKKGR